ncbi:E3 ubiquitin-protein ligase ubr1, partial [Linderina pennispora]
MDDTCVLCTRCFQATDHTGHDTSFSVNSGTGGCCDCGDPEAWKIPLRCRHHSSFEELDEIGFDPIISSAGAPFVPGYNNHNECPVSVRRAIELTIAVVLEFILETFSTSPVHLRTSFDERSIIEDAQSASEALGDPEVQTKFAIVLWNDEVHSFQDVIDQCTQALDCSPVEARKIAETVDVSGRDVLRVSTSITDLIEIATSMVNVSLCISIRAARDVFREQLSASLLIWLRDLACCKFRPLARVFQGKVNNEIRSEISHQLCLRWEAPFRNNYLADILFKQYSYDIRPMDSDTEDVYADGELDDEEYLDEDDEESVDDEGAITQDESNAVQSPAGAAAAPGNAAFQHAHAATSAAAAAQEIGMVVDLSDAQDAQMRGRRRLRSDSTDSLRQQGEERGSPRNYPQPGAVHGRNDSNAGAPPPSLWLNETA